MSITQQGLAIGFIQLGIYTLPILTAETGLSTTELVQLEAECMRKSFVVREFSRQNPGPDYRLYLTKMQVSSKQEFLDIKDDALQIAPIKAFRNFSVSVPAGVATGDYGGIIVWCERFGAFITSASLN